MGVVRPIHDWLGRRMRRGKFWEYCERRRVEGDGGYEGCMDQYYWRDETALREGDVIGLLRDLDEGSALPAYM